MREIRSYGSVGVPGGQPPGSTRIPERVDPRARLRLRVAVGIENARCRLQEHVLSGYPTRLRTCPHGLAPVRETGGDNSCYDDVGTAWSFPLLAVLGFGSFWLGQLVGVLDWQPVAAALRCAS